MNLSGQPRILIVDDHPFICQAMGMFMKIIFQDAHIIGEAHNACDAMRLCRLLSPDIVLIDIVMPDVNGVELARKILEDSPNIKIVGLTSLEKSDPAVHQLIDAGAVGCINKHADAEEIVEVFRECGILPQVPERTPSK